MIKRAGQARLPHPREPIFQVEAVVVVRRDHSLAKLRRIGLAELLAHDLLVTHARSLPRQGLEQHCREAGLTPRYCFEAPNDVVVCQMVALADPFVAFVTPAPQLVMQVFASPIPLPHGIFFPTWQPRPAIVAQFAEPVAETALKEADALRRTLHRR